MVEQIHMNTVSRKHVCGHMSEVLAVATRVVCHHDRDGRFTCVNMLQQICRKALSSTCNSHTIHPRRPDAHDLADATGTKMKFARKGSFLLCGVLEPLELPRLNVVS